MKYLTFTLFTLLLSSPAQANLCDPNRWPSASGPSVQASMQMGYSPTQPCPNSSNGDYPIHLAAVLANDAGAVQALIDAGASPLTRNAAGQTAISLFEARYEQVAVYGQPSSAITAMARIFNVQFEALAAAQNNLCDLEWWTSATGSKAEVIVRTSGIDLDARCDSEGNTPLHIALSLEDYVSDYQRNAIQWLVYAGAPNIPNRRGITPLSLVENRYQRALIRWNNVIRPQICNGLRGVGAQLDAEIDTYYYMRREYAGETLEEVRGRTQSNMSNQC